MGDIQGEAITPDEAVLRWLYVGDRRMGRDRRIVEPTLWSPWNSLTTCLCQCSTYVMMVPVMVATLLVMRKMLNNICTKPRKKDNQTVSSVKLPGSRCKPKAPDVSATVKCLMKEGKSSAVPITEVKSQCSLRTKLTQGIWNNFSWLYHCMYQASSPEIKTTRKPAGPVFRVTKNSPLKKHGNSTINLANPGKSSVPLTHKSSSMEYKGKTPSNNITQSVPAHWNNETKIQTEVACSNKNETATNKISQGLGMAVDLDGKVRNSPMRGSSARYLNPEKASHLSMEVPEERTSILSNDLQARVAEDAVPETKKLCEKRDSKEREEEICELSEVDKLREACCFRTAGNEDSLILTQKRGFTRKRYEKASELNHRSDTNLVQLDTTSKSAVKQSDSLTGQGVSKSDNSAREGLLKKHLEQKKAKDCLDGLRTHPAKEENLLSHKYKQGIIPKTGLDSIRSKAHPKSRLSKSSSTSMAVDDATGDLITGDFSSICRKYEISEELRETTASVTFSSALCKIRNSQMERHNQEKVKDRVTSKRTSEKMAERKSQSTRARIHHSRPTSYDETHGLEENDDNFQSYNLLTSYVNDASKHVEKLPTVFKEKEGHFKNVTKTVPKQSKQLIPRNFKSGNLVFRDGQLPSESLHSKPLGAGLTCLLLDPLDCPSKNIRRLNSHKAGGCNYYKYIVPLSSLTYENTSQTASPSLTESSMETGISTKMTQVHVLQRSIEVQTEEFRSGFNTEHYNRGITLSACTVQSSSPLSFVSQLKQRSRKRQKPVSPQNSKRISINKHSGLLSKIKSKQSMVRNTKYLLSPPSKTNTITKCNTGLRKKPTGRSRSPLWNMYLKNEMGQDRVNIPEMPEALFRRRMKSGQLKEALTPSSAENTSLDNVAAWLSALESSQTGYADTQITEAGLTFGKHTKMVQADPSMGKHTEMTRARLAMTKLTQVAEADYAVKKNTKMTQSGLEIGKNTKMREAGHVIGKCSRMTQADLAMEKCTQMPEIGPVMGKLTKMTQAGLAIGKYAVMADAGRSIGKHNSTISDAGRVMEKHNTIYDAGRAMEKHNTTISDAGREMEKHNTIYDAGRSMGKHNTTISDAGRSMGKHNTTISDAGRAMEKYNSTISDAGREMEKHNTISDAGRAMEKHNTISDAGRAMEKYNNISDAGRAMEKYNTISDAGCAMGKQKTMTGERESTFPSCVQGKCIIQDWKKQEHIQHVYDSQSPIQPIKRKCTHTMASRSHIPIKKAVIDTVSHVDNKPDSKASGHMSASTLSQQKTRNRFLEKELIHKGWAQTSPPGGTLKMNDTGSEAWCERNHDNIYRKTQLYKTTEGQLLHPGVIPQNSKIPKSADYKNTITSRYKNQQEKQPNTITNPTPPQRKHQLQWKNCQPKQKSLRHTSVNVTASTSALNILETNIATPRKKKSPDFVHIPLFENVNNESVNIILRVNSAVQQALDEKQTQDAIEQAVPPFRGRSNSRKFRSGHLLEPANPESKLPKQEPTSKCDWTGIVSLSENQNASPRIFDEQKQAGIFRPTQTRIKQPPAGTREDAHGKCYLRQPLLSKRRYGQVHANSYKGDQTKDIIFTNAIASQCTDGSNFDHSTEEFISTASFSQFDQQPNNLEVTRNTSTKGTVIQNFSKPHTAETASTKGTYKLSTDKVLIKNNTFLLEKSDAEPPEYHNKPQLYKTSNTISPVILSQINNKTKRNDQDSLSDKAKEAHKIRNYRKQMPTAKETNKTTYYETSINAQANSKHRKKASKFKDKEYANKYQTNYYISESLDEDSKYMLTDDCTSNIIVGSMQLCAENHAQIYIDDQPEIALKNYSGLTSQFHSVIPKVDRAGMTAMNRSRISKDGGREITNEHCAGITTEYRKEIISGHHKGIHNEHLAGIQYEDLRSIINKGIAGQSAKIAKLSSEHHTGIHNESFKGISTENNTQISSGHRTGIHNESFKGISTENNTQISSRHHTGIHNESFKGISTENNTQISSGHPTGIPSEYSTRLPIETKTRTFSPNNAKTGSGHLMGILTEYTTGIPIESKKISSFENNKQVYSVYRREVPNKNSTGINHEHCMRLQNVDRARKLVDNSARASKNKHEESLSMPDSRETKQTFRHERLQTLMMSDLDEPSSKERKKRPDSIIKAKQTQNAEDAVSNISNKQISKCDRGKVDVKSDDYTKNDEAPKTIFAETSFLKRQIHPHINLANVCGTKAHGNDTKPAYQFRKAQIDYKCPINSMENRAANLKIRQQKEQESGVRMEKVGLVSDANKIRYNAEACVLQGQCVSETVPTAQIKRRRCVEDVCSDTLDKTCDINDISQEDTEATYSYGDSSNFNKSLQDSIQQRESRYPSSHKEGNLSQDGGNVGKSEVLRKSRQMIQSKPQGISNDVRKTISGSTASRSQGSEMSFTLNTLSTLRTDMRVHEEDATLSSTFNYRQSSVRKLERDLKLDQANLVVPKQKNKIITLSGSKKPEMRNQTSNRTSTRYVHKMPGVSTLLEDELFMEIDNSKQSKVNEISMNTYLSQKTRKQMEEQENMQTSIILSATSHPDQTSPTLPVSNSIYHSNCLNSSRLKGSVASSTDVHLRTVTQDKMRKSNQLQEILLKKMFIFHGDQTKNDSMEESTDDQIGYSKQHCLRTCMGSLRSSYTDVTKNKIFQDNYATRRKCGEVSQADTCTRSKFTKKALKMSELEDSKCETVAIDRFKNSQRAVPIEKDSQYSISRHTVVKSCDSTTHLHQNDPENRLNGDFKGQLEVANSDHQTFVVSDFDNSDDSRLPESLPCKIGGSTDASLSATVLGDGSTKYNSNLINGKEGISTNTKDMQSTPLWNIDELREKYLREMTLRGLCRDKKDNINYGGYKRCHNLFQIAEYVPTKKRQKIGSDTTTIKSASSESPAPRIVLSGNTMTVEYSPTSYSVCGHSKIDLKRKRENDGHSTLINNVSQANNIFAIPNYAARGKGRDDRFSLSSREKTTIEGGEAIANSDNSKSLKQCASEIRKIWHRPSTPEISLNQSSSCRTGVLVSQNSRHQADVKKLNIKRQPGEITTGSQGLQSENTQGGYKTYSHCSSCSAIPPIDHSELLSQKDQISEINKTKNASYTLDSTRSIHVSFRENPSIMSGLKINGHLSSIGKSAHNLGKMGLSRIPKRKRLAASSRRMPHSDTQCFGSYENMAKENRKDIRSWSCNTMDTKYRKQFRNQAEPKSWNQDYCNTISERYRKQQSGDDKSSCSSTDVVASWLNKNDAQEQVSKTLINNVLTNACCNRGNGSSRSALIYPSSNLGNSHGEAGPNKLEELTSQTLTRDQIGTEKTETLMEKYKHDRADKKSVLKDTPKLETGRRRRKCPKLKSFFDKLPQKCTQNRELTRKAAAEIEIPSWESKLQPQPAQGELAADATIVKTSTVQESTKRSELELGHGLSEIGSFDKRLSTVESFFSKLNTGTPTKKDEKFKSFDLKDMGTKQKVSPEVNFCGAGPNRTMRCVRNRKYVNSALMYNMKKQNVVSPNKQYTETKQQHFETKDPALGTNNSARLDKQDLHTKFKSLLFDFNVSNRDAKPSNEIKSQIHPPGLAQTSKGLTEYSKQDQNAIYFIVKQEPSCENTNRPAVKSEMIRELSDKELTQPRFSLAKEKCASSRCEMRQRVVSDECVINQNSDSNKMSDDREKWQSGESHQLSHEETDDDDTEDDNIKENIPENYHTSDSMFVASNSCKVSFDWYKPSATLAAQTSENDQGQINGASGSVGNDQTHQSVPSCHLTELCDAPGSSAASSKYRVFSPQNYKPKVETSQHLWLSLNQQQHDHHPTCVSANCLVSTNFFSGKRGSSTERTRNHINPTIHLSSTQPNSNTPNSTSSSRPQNPILYEMNENFIHNSLEKRNSYTSEATTSFSDSRQYFAPDTACSASQSHRRQPNLDEHTVTADVSLSNLNSVYQTLRKEYTETNAVFHSNWVQANQNHSLSSLAPITAQCYFCTKTGTDVHSAQIQHMLQQSCSETPVENINGTYSTENL